MVFSRPKQRGVAEAGTSQLSPGNSAKFCNYKMSNNNKVPKVRQVILGEQSSLVSYRRTLGSYAKVPKLGCKLWIVIAPFWVVRLNTQSEQVDSPNIIKLTVIK